MQNWGSTIILTNMEFTQVTSIQIWSKSVPQYNKSKEKVKIFMTATR